MPTKKTTNKTTMEGVIAQLKRDYPVERVTHDDDGSVEVDCGRLTGRLDLYTCGNEGCECEENDGWCEEAWVENCAGPIEKKFKEWKKQYLTDGIEAWGSVGEKGWFYVTLKPVKKPQPQEEEQPSKKRCKTD